MKAICLDSSSSDFGHFDHDEEKGQVTSTPLPLVEIGVAQVSYRIFVPSIESTVAILDSYTYNAQSKQLCRKMTKNVKMRN